MNAQRNPARGASGWIGAGVVGLTLGLAPVGCGGDEGGGDAPGPDAIVGLDVPPATDSAEGGGEDVPDPVAPAVPRIDQALACGVDGNVGGLSGSQSPQALERKTLDTTRFPDALCNDGSDAVVYVRPATRPEDADKWVLELMGGGACNTMQACANRWCSVDTNFSRTQMTSATAPPRTEGDGILLRPDQGSGGGASAVDNPFASWNHVLLKYCSSDTWRGTARDVTVESDHPRSGEPVTFRMHFLGRRILEAAVATLRRDGVDGLSWGPDATPMPDLDDATEVVFAGASAGGGGVTFNLDWLSETLRAANPGVDVTGLIDSTFGPDLIGLDFAKSAYCQELRTCTAEAFLGRGRIAQETLWKAAPEASCEASHAASGGGWKCASDTFVMLNHLTTPFFVRQGLADGLISEVYVKGGLQHAGEAIDLRVFGELVRASLETFPQLPQTAIEGASIATAPGAYGPACPKHETLRSTRDTFDVTIDVGGDALRMFDVWRRWRDGGSPQVAVTRTRVDTTCPGE
jgi:hypothetical protein